MGMRDRARSQVLGMVGGAAGWCALGVPGLMASVRDSTKSWVVFFFQAEDGIRDWSVTGVQTCALPISAILWTTDADLRVTSRSGTGPKSLELLPSRVPGASLLEQYNRGEVTSDSVDAQIGRASCRERV